MKYSLNPKNDAKRTDVISVKNLKIYNYNYLSDFKEIINEIIN